MNNNYKKRWFLFFRLWVKQWNCYGIPMSHKLFLFEKLIGKLEKWVTYKYYKHVTINILRILFKKFDIQKIWID